MFMLLSDAMHCVLSANSSEVELLRNRTAVKWCPTAHLRDSETFVRRYNQSVGVQFMN